MNYNGSESKRFFRLFSQSALLKILLVKTFKHLNNTKKSDNQNAYIYLVAEILPLLYYLMLFQFTMKCLQKSFLIFILCYSSTMLPFHVEYVQILFSVSKVVSEKFNIYTNTQLYAYIIYICTSRARFFR